MRTDTITQGYPGGMIPLPTKAQYSWTYHPLFAKQEEEDNGEDDIQVRESPDEGVPSR